MTIAALLEDVSKRYGRVVALAGVSLEVRSGEVVALLGPNGAGKTTAINILLGLRKPDAGRACMFGRNPTEPAARRRVGVIPQEIAFPPTVTVDDAIDLVRRHYEQPHLRDEVVERFSLAPIRARRAGGLSSGERRRLGLALAFVGRPDLVVLDEPTAGLDLEARHGFWQEVREFSQRGGAALLTTHYLEEAKALSQRIVLLNKGRVMAAGSVREVAGSIGLARLRFEASSLPDLPGVVHVAREGAEWIVQCRDADALVRELVRADVAFRGLEIQRLSLEHAVLALTGAE
jgi:ABC-2 type transport system ATP-binding protein